MEDNMKYVISEDSDYLEHIGKGEALRDHLYKARNWVNGKWRYVYNSVNNALGADERARKDHSYEGYKYSVAATDKANRKLAEATDTYKKANDQNNLYDNYGREKRTRNAANTARSNNLKRYENAYNRASQAKKTQDLYKAAYDKDKAAYDKTIYGKIEKGKEFISNIINKLKKKQADRKYNRDVKKYAKSQGRSKRSGFQSEREYQEFMRNRK